MSAECSAKWDDHERVIVLSKNHTYARGLTKTLSSTFSPEFSISLVLKSLPNIKEKKHGRQQGNVVDQQLTDWALHKQMPQVNTERFTYIKSVLDSRGWDIINAQLPLGCNELRLGTKLDLLCRDREGRMIIIELKCGFDDYFYVANQGNMLYPFHYIPTSFFHKSMIQLLVTTWLFFHNQNNQPFGGSYLLHVFETDNGKLSHTLQPLPFWLFASTEIIEQALLVLKQTRNQNKRKRIQNMQNGSRRIRRKFLQNAE